MALWDKERREHHKLYMREWRARNPEKYRAIWLKHDATHSKQKYERKKRFCARHPEQIKARNPMYKAIQRGELVRSPFCQLCLGVGRIEAHHQDYSRRLDVVWLCHRCHKGIEHKTRDFLKERERKAA